MAHNDTERIILADDARIFAQETKSERSSIVNISGRMTRNKNDSGFKSEFVLLAPFQLRSIKIFQSGKSLADRIIYVTSTTFTMVSGRWFCNNLMDCMEYTSPGDVYDRLLGEWSTMGIVSALTLSFAFNAFLGLIPNPEGLTFSGIDALLVINIMTFVSICCLFTSLCSSIILSMALMTLPKQASVAFTREMKVFITFPEFFMVSGLMIFSSSMVLAGYAMSGELFIRFCAPIIAGAFGLLSLSWIVIVLTLDRVGGLWEIAKISDSAKVTN